MFHWHICVTWSMVKCLPSSFQHIPGSTYTKVKRGSLSMVRFQIFTNGYRVIQYVQNSRIDTHFKVSQEIPIGLYNTTWIPVILYIIIIYKSFLIGRGKMFQFRNENTTAQGLNLSGIICRNFLIFARLPGRDILLTHVRISRTKWKCARGIGNKFYYCWSCKCCENL